MATNSVIDATTGVVLNTLRVGPEGLPENWPVPSGCALVRQDGGMVGGTWDGSQFLPPQTPPPETPVRWPVRKLLIIDRLSAAGLFSAAMSALGGPGALAYERWSAASVIDSDDAEVRGLLTAIGADPDAILAMGADR